MDRDLNYAKIFAACLLASLLARALDHYFM